MTVIEFNSKLDGMTSLYIGIMNDDSIWFLDITKYKSPLYKLDEAITIDSENEFHARNLLLTVNHVFGKSNNIFGKHEFKDIIRANPEQVTKMNILLNNID